MKKVFIFMLQHKGQKKEQKESKLMNTLQTNLFLIWEEHVLNKELYERKHDKFKEINEYYKLFPSV